MQLITRVYCTCSLHDRTFKHLRQRVAVSFVRVITNVAKRRSHYEVLGVKPSATAVDIKAAFIQMSKKYHPDKNMDDPSMHAKFVELNEAYSVLSDLSTRSLYDAGLRGAARYSATHQSSEGPFYYNQSYSEHSSQKFYDASFWEHRDKSNDEHFKKKPYYGIRGVPRLPNTVIAVGIFVFISLGIIMHIVAVKTTTQYRIKKMEENDKICSKILDDAQQQAQLHSKEQQLQIMTQRITEQAESYRKLRGIKDADST